MCGHIQSKFDRNSRAAGRLVTWALGFGFAALVPLAAAQPVTNGLTLALQADALTGYTNGQPVPAWPDRSPNALDVSQTNPSLQPVYVADALHGQPAVRFNNASYLWRDAVLGALLTSTDQATAYVVVKQVGTDPYNSILGWGTGSNRLLMHTTWGDILAFQHGNANSGGGGGAGWTQPAGWDDQFHLVEFILAGTNCDCLVDGAGLGRQQITDTPEINEIHPLYIGTDYNGNLLSGDACEVLLYNRALTHAERTQTVTYLSQKYGLPLHPVALGDLNCDGRVDFSDINPFVLALTDPVAYYTQQYPGCNLLNGDINCDGAMSFSDINGFVGCLTSGACDCQ